MKKKILGIIGIRSGSKGLKNKNVKMLNGKPLISWIIDSAKNSKYINRVLVSTDSHRYEKIAKKFNAEVPFIRPKKISKDNSNEIEFIKHTLDYLKKKEKYIPDIVVRMLATVPFQKSDDIDKLINLILRNKYESASIISKAKQHPKKSLKIVGNKKKYLVSFITGKGVDVGKKLNRQSLNEKDEVYFRSNVLACKVKVIKKYNSMTNNKVGYIIIPNSNFIDIDTIEDFNYAKYLAKNKLI